MKISRLHVIMIGLLWLWAVAAQGQTYTILWNQLQEAERKALPQQVIQLAGRIEEKACREQQAGQLFKAVLWKGHYQQQLTPDSLFPDMARMERWCAEEKDEVNQALLHSMLATRYALYLRATSYQIDQRTELLPEETPQDIRTWSRGLFLATIERHLQASLSHPERLMQVGAADYQPLVIQQDASAWYGHDLYHLLARQALALYSQIGDLWRLGSSNRSQAKIDSLYAEMQTRYSQVGQRTACLMVTIEQLRAHTEVPMERLDSLMMTYADEPLCAELYIEKVRGLMKRGEHHTAEAIKVCDEGLRRYPRYARVNELRNLKAQLLQPRLTASLAGTYYPGDSLRLRLQYRHLASMRMRIYKAKVEEYPMEYAEDEVRLGALRGRQIWSETYTLPVHRQEGVAPDEWPYLTNRQEQAFALSLDEGLYVVELEPLGVAKPEKALFLLPVSRLHLLFLDQPDDRGELRVVDWKSGQPVVGAQVRCFVPREGEVDSLYITLRSDAEGRCRIDSVMRNSYCRVSMASDRALPPFHFQRWGIYRKPTVNIQKTMRLLTDRAIYRPGQTVQLKGIYYSQLGEEAATIPNCSVEVILLDANRKEVSRQTAVTNAYGSFAASFVLPKSCLNGRFVLKSSVGGETAIRVEEYKRPSFEVTLLHPSVPYCWGDSLQLQGSVMGYQGAPVQRAAVAYTLKEMTFDFPWQSGERPLRQDTVYTDGMGRFTIPLYLDNAFALEGYQVEATVVSADGESQQAALYLPVGVKSFSFTTSLPAQLCKEDSLQIMVGVENLLGERIEAVGRYVLYATGEEKTDYTHPVAEGRLHLNQLNDLHTWRSLPSGRYRCVLEASTPDARTVRDTLAPFVLFSQGDTRLPKGVNRLVYRQQLSFDAEHPAVIYFGVAGRDSIYLYRDEVSGQRLVKQELQVIADTLMRIEILYREAYGKELQLAMGYVKEGMIHLEKFQLSKPDQPKRLQLKWNVMRNQLIPGQQEEWQLQVLQDGKGCAAELMALLYDASLDRFVSHDPTLTLSRARTFIYSYSWHSQPHPLPYRSFNFSWKAAKVPAWAFDELAWPQSSLHQLDGVMLMPVEVRASNRVMASAATDQLTMEEKVMMEEESGVQAKEIKEKPFQLRDKLNETAFFYPQLATDAEGNVTLRFVAPQRLTRWNFIGFAHTQQMWTGVLRSTVVTAKEFMLQPQWPRYVRVGDEMELSATITNQTAQPQQGRVKLTLFDPSTDQVLQVKKLSFAVQPMGSEVVRFPLHLTDERAVVGLRMVADGEHFSDGEQQVLPVLSRKVLVTETIPLVLHGKSNYTISLDTLFNGRSPQATQRQLTLEMAGNPAWYAVAALPDFEQPETDNAIRWAASLYGESLGLHIVKQHPEIERLFTAWRAQGVEQQALRSRLEQQEELKELLLAESPWVMEAESETERQLRIARFFDVNQMNYRLTTALAKLRQMQLPSGAWGWFAGMHGNRFVTHFVLQQLYRLQMLTGEPLTAEAAEMARKGMHYLHEEALARYKERHRATHPDKLPVATQQELDYLYLLAISGEPLTEAQRKVVDESLRVWEAARGATSLVQKARLVVVLLAHGKKEAAAEVVQSIKEHLTWTTDRGAYLAMNEPLVWGMNNISIHVACMEALQRVGGEEELLEQMKVWLLLQKQTRSWNQQVASADAVYALLMQGRRRAWQQSGHVRLTLGKEQIDTSSTEALDGVAAIQRSFGEGDAALNSRTLQVEKMDEGIAWGALYARSLVPVEEVKAYGQGLRMEKQLYVERIDAAGHSRLERMVEGVTRVAVGDKVVARLVLRTDRSMDFVQLKDQRGACFEPLSVYSGYRWNRGLGYYLDVKDASATYFFDHLPKGVHVLEHAYRVVRAGAYEAGMASMQCAYAPEFAAHSATQRVEIVR